MSDGLNAKVVELLDLYEQMDEEVRRETERLLTGLGAAVKRKRESMGLSQQFVARSARLGQSWVSKLEAGELKNAELKSLVRITMVLGMDLVLELRKIK